jgi:hypothetical protein
MNALDKVKPGNAARLELNRLQPGTFMESRLLLLVLAALAGDCRRRERKQEGLWVVGFELDNFLDCRTGFEACMNRNVFRRFDAKSHTVPANLENGNLDILGHDDFLILFTANDKHTRISLFSIWAITEEIGQVPKNTASF